MKKTLPLLLVVSCLLFFVAFVKAQSTERALRAENTASRCSRLTANIDKRISKYNDGTDHPRLTKLQEKLTAAVAKIKAPGVDTTKLETDLATLKTKTEACRIAYGLFITRLQETKKYACGQSQGQFANAVRVARKELKKARPVCQDARKFLRFTVKVDLQAIREQHKNLRKPTLTITPTVTPVLNRTQ